MSLCYKYDGLLVTTADGWFDVTDQIEADEQPFTLTKPDGVGAIQFSVATYQRGPAPDTTITQLKQLLIDFSLSRELGRGFDFFESKVEILICARSFNYSTNFLRVWYCSDGRNVALVTYVCERGSEGEELSDCERMVCDLRFESGAGGSTEACS